MNTGPLDATGAKLTGDAAAHFASPRFQRRAAAIGVDCHCRALSCRRLAEAAATALVLESVSITGNLVAWPLRRGRQPHNGHPNGSAPVPRPGFMGAGADRPQHAAVRS